MGGRRLRSFFTALQFLTRIHLVEQRDLTAADFGRSTRCFPLVGAVLGALYLLAAWLLGAWRGGVSHTGAAVLVLLPILLTGGLHCDGFMDTVDGLFSGRSRTRMLEIMKDSRTGSFGVVAFGVCLLLDWSLMLDLLAASAVLLPALFLMPVVGRMAMVRAIACFPYARPEGMGKAFAAAADGRTRGIAAVTAALCILPWGPLPLLLSLVALFVATLFDRYAASKLGGLTGDVYGATEKLTETLLLLLFWGAAVFWGSAPFLKGWLLLWN